LPRPLQLGLGLFGQRQVERGVPASRFPRFARLFQLLPPVLPHRLKQPVARLLLEQYQRFVHQRAQQVQHPSLLDVFSFDHRFGGIEREAPREHR
jgi:hypothetical protein